MTAATTQTISHFINANHLRMTAEWADLNPHMDDANNMDHWKIVIRQGRKSFTTYFSQGYGHNGNEPKLDDVLDCLASDAAGYENASNFEDWTSEYGYDTDSRKAEHTFNTIRRQAERLQQFLGDDAYQNLLWNTERL